MNSSIVFTTGKIRPADYTDVKHSDESYFKITISEDGKLESLINEKYEALVTKNFGKVNESEEWEKTVDYSSIITNVEDITAFEVSRGHSENWKFCMHTNSSIVITHALPTYKEANNLCISIMNAKDNYLKEKHNERIG